MGTVEGEEGEEGEEGVEGVESGRTVTLVRLSDKLKVYCAMNHTGNTTADARAVSHHVYIASTEFDSLPPPPSPPLTLPYAAASTPLPRRPGSPTCPSSLPSAWIVASPWSDGERSSSFRASSSAPVCVAPGTS
jgi:hypothetical protein